MSPSSLEIIGLCDICEEHIVEDDFEDEGCMEESKAYTPKYSS